MSRTVKKPEERRLELVQTAEILFAENGYKNTSIEAIIKKIGVAKGTFYYYFKSKEDVLQAIVDSKLEDILNMVNQVASDPSLDALTKMKLLLSNNSMSDDTTNEIAEHLHLPTNRELHEVTNIQTVLKLSPIFAEIIEQGNREKIFRVERPLETFQFLLTGFQFLLDGGLFDFNEEEIRDRKTAMQNIVEHALGAESGSFYFLNDN